MDIFGKSTVPKSSFQNELAAKMKQRKAAGLGADLTETEDEDNDKASDDDLFTAYSRTQLSKPERKRSESPWKAESAAGRITPSEDKPKSPSLSHNKGRNTPTNKPKNELDRLLMDDENEDGKFNLLKTQRKPWQPPRFKELQPDNQTKPVPKERVQKPKSQEEKRRTPQSVRDSDDEEVADAYKNRVNGRKSPSENARTPIIDESRLTPTNRQPGSTRSTRDKNKENQALTKDSSAAKEDVFGKHTPKASSTLDAIFGKRKSPTDLGHKQSHLDDIFRRETPHKDAEDLYRPKSRNSEKLELSQRGDGEQKSGDTNTDLVFGRKTPQQSKTLDDIFGTRRSPNLEHSKPKPEARKSSYLASLLGDSDKEEKEEKHLNTRSPYLDQLLGDDQEKQQKKPASYLDKLLDTEDEPVYRQSRPRVKPAPSERERSKEADERESSVCRDVDKDPQMVERLTKEREQKKSLRRTPQTDNQKAEFDIEEVADAQNPLSMTYIEAEKPSPSVKPLTPTPVRPKTTKSRTKTVVSPDLSTLSFDSATDIRKYIYQEWKEKKMALTEEQLLQKRKKQKEEKDKLAQEKINKKLENEATFRSWKETKDQRLKKQVREKRAAEKAKEEEEKKQAEKKKEAEINFKRWKEAQDEKIKEKLRAKKKEEIEQLEQQKETIKIKKKGSEGAFSGWKKQKDVKIIQSLKETQQREKLNEMRKKAEERHREIEAERFYESWLERKAEQQKREKRRLRRMEDNESPRPAWSPANKTIPCGR